MSHPPCVTSWKVMKHLPPLLSVLIKYPFHSRSLEVWMINLQVSYWIWCYIDNYKWTCNYSGKGKRGQLSLVPSPTRTQKGGWVQYWKLSESEFVKVINLLRSKYSHMGMPPYVALGRDPWSVLYGQETQQEVKSPSPLHVWVLGGVNISF